MNLRPSNLPKLAVCACYSPNPDAGPAARADPLLMPCSVHGCREPGSGGNVLPATDEDLRGGRMGRFRWLEHWRVDHRSSPRKRMPRLHSRLRESRHADALIPDKLAHADLKTGQNAITGSKMAAYALGLMEQHFASEWTAHLLFCDRRKLSRSGSRSMR